MKEILHSWTHLGKCHKGGLGSMHEGLSSISTGEVGNCHAIHGGVYQWKQSKTNMVSLYKRVIFRMCMNVEVQNIRLKGWLLPSFRESGILSITVSDDIKKNTHKNDVL